MVSGWQLVFSQLKLGLFRPLPAGHDSFLFHIAKEDVDGADGSAASHTFRCHGSLPTSRRRCFHPAHRHDRVAQDDVLRLGHPGDLGLEVMLVFLLAIGQAVQVVLEFLCDRAW